MPRKAITSGRQGESQYGNVGVTLAAYLAETKSKTSFETLCQKGIFDPFGMQGC
mgnify:CR=1 FL=1